jgi:mannose-6-phosphate isomerase-like protein (cupin superfamily)
MNKFVEKRWGHERWFANNKEENYCHTSMHFHLNKHEVFYILEGTLRLDLIDTKKGKINTIYINKEESYEVAQGQPHQLIAHEGLVKIIEASTFHEDSDSYRIHDCLDE